MTLYDSSVLIDYLAGNAAAVEYVEERLDARAVTVPLVLYEVYQGEIFKSGPADFDAVDRALEWLSVVDETADLARTAAELQGTLQRGGDVLTVRDAFIAGAAKGWETHSPFRTRISTPRGSLTVSISSLSNPAALWIY